MDFVTKLKLDMERLEREYEARGTVTWSQFKADPAAHSKKVVELSQSDFATGTLRVLHPCKLKLTSDVLFNPNRPTMLKNGAGKDIAIDPARTLDWFPEASQSEYFEADVRSAYHLGFFAAIAIEAEGVVLDLNNYGIGQHKEHALMQQFFSCVELSDQPFPVGSGPANFGSTLRRAKKVWIKNGTLGYSSHQNLHSNDAQEILVTNVIMRDSTVAGFASNGAKKVALIDCEYRGTRQDVKVNGAFNEIRLDTKLFEGAMAAGVSLSAAQEDAYDRAKAAIEDIFNQVIFGAGTISDTPTAALTAADISILKNTTGMPDGISYACLINPQDVAVGAFLESRDIKGSETSEIALIRCNFEKVVAKPREVMALSPAISGSQETAAGGYNVNAQQRGSTGAVLEYLRCFDANGEYAGNVVSDMQLEIAALQNSLPSAQKPMLGSINIEPLFIEMKHATALGQTLKLVPVAGEHSKVWELALKSTGAIYEDPTRPALLMEFVALANGDIQHHQLKGVIGLRIEGASDVTLEKVTVSTVKNAAELGYDYEGKGYIGDTDGGQGGQGAMVGFFGNHTRGVSLAACSGVKVSDLTVSGVESVTGPAIGIDLRGETSDVSMARVDIRKVSAGSSSAFAVENAAQPVKDFAYNNWKPTATGLRADSSVSHAKVESLKVENLSQPVESPKPLQLESASVKLS